MRATENLALREHNKNPFILISCHSPMKSIHQLPLPLRLTYSIFQNSWGTIGRPKQTLKFLKTWLRYPLEYAATQQINQTPTVGFSELFPDFALPESVAALKNLDRHDWNVRLDEKIYLGFFGASIKRTTYFRDRHLRWWHHFDFGTVRVRASASMDARFAAAGVRPHSKPQRVFGRPGRRQIS